MAVRASALLERVQTVADRITVTGTANLILCDGKTLTASKGITVAEGATLNIYAQSEGTGALAATATDSKNYAGIGGEPDQAGGTIIIHGGTVTAAGGENGAGIGGGNHGAGGSVTIFDGMITSTDFDCGAGIGGGNLASGGTVTIYGGTVSATGGVLAAGIGGGDYGSGGTVTIHGGTVTATGKQYSAGIGGGGLYMSGKGGKGASVTINGGTVIANGGDVTVNGGDPAVGIGGGDKSDDNGTLTLGDGVSMLISTDNSTWSEYDPASDNRARYMKTATGHTHSFGFTASGATVTYKCQNEGCTLGTATVTIVAPTLTVEGGTGSEKATLTQTGLTNDFLASIGEPEGMTTEYLMEQYKSLIRYTGIGNTTYAESATAPATAGKYKASFTVAEGVTAFVEYEIAEAGDQTVVVTKAPEAKNLTYNGSAQELVTAGEANGGTMQYALSTDAATSPADDLYTTAIPTATNAGN